MKNKGIIISIICLCVLVIISTIIICATVAASNNNVYVTEDEDTIRITAEIKKDKPKESSLDVFEKKYGEPAQDVADYLEGQLALTYENRELMKWNGSGDYLNKELIKLNDIDEIKIWRNVEDSDSEDTLIYADNTRLRNPEVLVLADEIDGEYKFTVCTKVHMDGEYIVFEKDKDGWYADRLEKINY